MRSRFAFVVIACAAAPLLASVLSAQAPARPAVQLSYTGPGSCAATSCHGSVRPVAGSRIPQTEYTTWITQDRHAKATEVLDSPISQRMARLLGLPRADTAPRCLGCHSIDVPEAQRARSFTAEGVSCESCHGPASAWLGPHTTRGMTHAQSVAAGMIDTKDLVVRTERCASCHVGTSEHVVDHEMIAAGHPDLVFDLEAFSAAMPRHWAESAPDDPWRSVRAWSVGQIVLLRESMERVSRSAARSPAVDFSELDCFSCHHSLTRPDDSWRQEAGYPNRQPGDPPLSHARMAIATLIARTLDPAAASQIDSALAQVETAAAARPVRPEDLAAKSAALRPALDGVARKASAATLDRAQVLRLIRTIADHADQIAAFGERSAEQGAMSLDVLVTAYAKNETKGEKSVDAKAARAALNRLLKQFENPSAYDPRRFAPAVKQVSDLLSFER